MKKISKFYTNSVAAEEGQIIATKQFINDQILQLTQDAPSGMNTFKKVSDSIYELSTSLNQKITQPAGKAANKVLGTDLSGNITWKNEQPGGVTSVNGLSGDVVLSFPEITLAECTGLGMIQGTNLEFSWVDPDNVILNGSTLAKWNKTVLVRKQGSYPANSTDGTILATTSIQLQNKNYYRDHNFIDTTITAGTTYYYKLFSQTTNETWNNLTENEYSSGTGLSWSQIQRYVKAGKGAELFPVGTVFEVAHSEYTHADNTGIYFRVVGHDQIPAQNQTLQHTMCLQMTQTLFDAQYDSPEYLYVLTEDTTFKAGKTYYTYISGSVYQAATEDTDYNIDDIIPMATYYQKNDQNRVNYGSNNPNESNLLQWANSENVAGQVFTKKTLWDKFSSSYSSRNGFLKNIDPEFKSVLVNAKLLTALNTVTDGGGTTYVNTKMFPLSIGQVFNNTNNGTKEGIQLKYYADGGSKVKCQMDSTTAHNWWLRSPSTGNSGGVYRVATSGTLGSFDARYSYGVSLACLIA